MKKWLKYIVVAGIGICALLCVVLITAGKNNNTIVLKTNSSTFTESHFLARIDLICRKYNLTSGDLYSDAGFWNQVVRDTVFEYAGAEIAREIVVQQGINQLSDIQRQEAEAYAVSVLDDIRAIGEDPDEYLAQLGFDQESLIVYAENQIFEAIVQEQWAGEIELSEDPGKAYYEKVLNYTKRMWEEIDARVAAEEYYLDISSLLQETE